MSVVHPPLGKHPPTPAEPLNLEWPLSFRAQVLLRRRMHRGGAIEDRPSRCLGRSHRGVGTAVEERSRAAGPHTHGMRTRMRRWQTLLAAAPGLPLRPVRRSPGQRSTICSGGFFRCPRFDLQHPPHPTKPLHGVSGPRRSDPCAPTYHPNTHEAATFEAFFMSTGDGEKETL